MNSEELFNLLGCICKPKNVSFYVIASDEFDQVSFEKLPVIIIFNASPRNSSTNGTHWLAACVTRKRHHNINIEVFDPLGKKVEDYGLKFRYAVKTENKIKIQGDESDKCGEFTLFWCYHQLNGTPTSHFITFFSNNVCQNDAIVEKFSRRLKRCCFFYINVCENKLTCIRPSLFLKACISS